METDLSKLDALFIKYAGASVEVAAADIRKLVEQLQAEVERLRSVETAAASWTAIRHELQELIRKHATSAGECPAQCRVVLVSSLQRVIPAPASSADTPKHNVLESGPLEDSAGVVAGKQSDFSPDCNPESTQIRTATCSCISERLVPCGGFVGLHTEPCVYCGHSRACHKEDGKP